jgi:hypothetical protein
MKNEIKILIAAIVVILIILVGAFALSGSSPQPSATPTVVPVTATPTTVPANGGNNGTVTVTPAPTVVAPTPTPTPTPTPEPASGVKKTEFGYWITYPPLPPQNWSSPQQPSEPLWNVTYFDPNSAVIDYSFKNTATKGEGDYRRSYIQRVGDMNGTVNVTFMILASGNVDISSVKEKTASEASGYDYYAYIHDEYGNLDYLGGNVYTMTFGPGVGEQYVCVHVDREYAAGDITTMPYAWVELTIVGADGGYGIYYPQRDFKVTVKQRQEVYFDTSEGYINYNNGQITSEDFYSFDNSSANKAYVTIPVYREQTTGSLPLVIDLDSPNSAVTLDPVTFAAGSDEAYLRVGIDKSYIMTGTYHDIEIDIEDTDDYYAYDYNYFDIYLND